MGSWRHAARARYVRRWGGLLPHHTPVVRSATCASFPALLAPALRIPIGEPAIANLMHARPNADPRRPEERFSAMAPTNDAHHFEVKPQMPAVFRERSGRSAESQKIEKSSGRSPCRPSLTSSQRGIRNISPRLWCRVCGAGRSDSRRGAILRRGFLTNMKRHYCGVPIHTLRVP